MSEGGSFSVTDTMADEEHGEDVTESGRIAKKPRLPKNLNFEVEPGNGENLQLLKAHVAQKHLVEAMTLSPAEEKLKLQKEHFQRTEARKNLWCDLKKCPLELEN